MTQPLSTTPTGRRLTPTAVLIAQLAAAVEDLGGLDQLPVDRLGQLHDAAARYRGDLGTWRHDLDTAHAAAAEPTDLSDLIDWTDDDLPALDLLDTAALGPRARELYWARLAAARDELAALDDSDNPDPYGTDADWIALGVALGQARGMAA